MPWMGENSERGGIAGEPSVRQTLSRTTGVVVSEACFRGIGAWSVVNGSVCRPLCFNMVHFDPHPAFLG